MDSVMSMDLICVNDQRNFEIFNLISRSQTALSKSYVVPKIGNVQMLPAKDVILVALDVKYQCAWNAIVPRLIEIGNTRCPQLLSSMT